MHSGNGIPRTALCFNSIGYVYPLQDEHTILQLNFAFDVRDQSFPARIDLARFQRAAKCSGQSATGGCDHIVDRGGVRYTDVRAHAIVFGNRSVNTKTNRFLFRWHVSEAQRTNLAFDLELRNIDNIRHLLLPSIGSNDYPLSCKVLLFPGNLYDSREWVRKDGEWRIEDRSNEDFWLLSCY